jgi:hypothetical protein
MIKCHPLTEDEWKASLEHASPAELEDLEYYLPSGIQKGFPHGLTPPAHSTYVYATEYRQQVAQWFAYFCDRMCEPSSPAKAAGSEATGTGVVGTAVTGTAVIGAAVNETGVAGKGAAGKHATGAGSSGIGAVGTGAAGTVATEVAKTQECQAKDATVIDKVKDDKQITKIIPAPVRGLTCNKLCTPATMGLLFEMNKCHPLLQQSATEYEFKATTSSLKKATSHAEFEYLKKNLPPCFPHGFTPPANSTPQYSTEYRQKLARWFKYLCDRMCERPSAPQVIKFGLFGLSGGGLFDKPPAKNGTNFGLFSNQETKNEGKTSNNASLFAAGSGVALFGSKTLAVANHAPPVIKFGSFGPSGGGLFDKSPAKTGTNFGLFSNQEAKKEGKKSNDASLFAAGSGVALFGSKTPAVANHVADSSNSGLFSNHKENAKEGKKKKSNLRRFGFRQAPTASSGGPSEANKASGESGQSASTSSGQFSAAKASVGDLPGASTTSSLFGPPKSTGNFKSKASAFPTHEHDVEKVKESLILLGYTKGIEVLRNSLGVKQPLFIDGESMLGTMELEDEEEKRLTGFVDGEYLKTFLTDLQKENPFWFAELFKRVIEPKK